MAPKKLNPNEWLAVGSILVAALFLRLTFFSGLARAGDALNYVHTAYALTNGVFDFHAWDGMLYLGLYSPVALLYWLFGPSETTTLFFPVASSLLSIVFIYAIAKLYAGKSAGLVAALIWAILPLDIYLATNLLPDGPLAAFCTGSAYFFLLATKTRIKKTSTILYATSGILVLWAILIKPIAIISLIYLLIAAALLSWPAIKRWFKMKWGFNADLVVICFLVILLLIVFWGYYETQSRPLLFSFVRSNNDLGAFFFTGATQLDYGDIDFIKSDLLVFLSPLFLISTTLLLLKHQENFRPLILWTAILFFYYEWGSTGLNPLTYIPLEPIQEARNILFILAPLVVLTGIYIGQNLKESFTQRAIPLLGVAICFIAFVSKADLYASGSTFLTATALFMLLVVTVLSPYFFYSVSPRIKHTFAIVLLGSLSLGMQQPFLPYHAVMFDKQAKALEDLRQSKSFWNERPHGLIYSSSPMALNYATNFELGYAWAGLQLPGLEPRIQNEPIPEGQSGYVVRADNSGVPINWWPEYVSDSHDVYIFRVLNTEEANAELNAAIQKMESEYSQENLVRLYGASINAGSWPSFFEAWTQLHLLEPDEYAIADLHERVVYFLQTHPHVLEGNLFYNSDFAVGLNGWILADDGQIDLTADASISIQTEVGESLMQRVILQPNQIYYFEVLLSTNDVSVDVLKVDQGDIPDTHITGVSPNNPTEFSAIFVTPNWEYENSVSIELFVSKDKGRVWLQQPLLIPISTVEKSE